MWGEACNNEENKVIFLAEEEKKDMIRTWSCMYIVHACFTLDG